MLDRFEELKALVEGTQIYQPPPVTNGPTQSYLKKIKLAQHSLYKVKKATFQIKDLKNLFSRSASIEEESSIKSKLRELVDFTNNELNKVRKVSEILSEELKNFENIDDIDLRLKSTMHATLMKQFQDAIAGLETGQNEFNEYARGKISGQLRMVQEDIDEETIEKCIENPKFAQMLVEKQMIGAHTDLILMVNRIEDRLEDIKMLEANISLMHKMFLDLATLVESQGEILNSIEMHVDKAKEYVALGTQAIVQAEQQLRSARSKKCCVLVIILVIGAIIAVPIVVVKYI